MRVTWLEWLNPSADAGRRVDSWLKVTPVTRPGQYLSLLGISVVARPAGEDDAADKIKVKIT